MLTCEVPLIQPSAAALHPQQEKDVSTNHFSKQVSRLQQTRPAFEVLINYVKMVPQRNKQFKSH